ncbi:MAG: hypothetical protein Q9187_007367, partial [Circinaria calcarea]
MSSSIVILFSATACMSWEKLEPQAPITRPRRRQERSTKRIRVRACDVLTLPSGCPPGLQAHVPLFLCYPLLEPYFTRCLRNNRAGNRSARTQIDHDIMEGLPVRQWRKTVGVVNTAPPRENSNVTNIRNAGWKELPMPRGSELYSPVCQALLRAARMGQVNRPPPPPLEDEKELGDDEDAEGEIDTGFLATKWTQVPRNMEEPEIEYLAKRRRGLPSAYGASMAPQNALGIMRKTKVRKVDPE